MYFAESDDLHRFEKYMRSVPFSEYENLGAILMVAHSAENIISKSKIV